MALTNEEKKGTYVSILSSDGSFRQVVPEGTPGSAIRDWETKDGTKGSKTELKFTTLTGVITSVSFHDGEYGKNLILAVNDGKSDDVILSLGTKQPFAEDIMKKLPNIDLQSEVTLKPYAFEDDKGKTRKGITVYQNGNKVEGAYWDVEGKKAVKGFPQPTGDTGKFDSDDWVAYFIEVRKYLIGKTEAIIEKGGFAKAPEMSDYDKAALEVAEEEKMGEDIPF